MKARTAPDGTTVYVATDEGERGADGLFAVAYRTRDRERRYGYLCTNCDSLDVAVDTMGRFVCNSCGNHRKPDEWDAAHE